jgi:hypothetical protein
LSKINKCDYKIIIENQDIVKWIRKIYPTHARNILCLNVNNLQNFLLEKNYKSVITSSAKFSSLLYLFDDINIQEIPILPVPKSLIKCVYDGDFSFFVENFLPQKDFIEAKNLFNFIRKYHNLPTIQSTRLHIEFDSNSKKRDKYIKKQLFSLNEFVSCKHSNDLYQIEQFGTNYILLKNLSTDKKEKKWIEDVIKISR